MYVGEVPGLVANLMQTVTGVGSRPGPQCGERRPGVSVEGEAAQFHRGSAASRPTSSSDLSSSQSSVHLGDSTGNGLVHLWARDGAVAETEVDNGGTGPLAHTSQLSQVPCPVSTWVTVLEVETGGAHLELITKPNWILLCRLGSVS